VCMCTRFNRPPPPAHFAIDVRLPHSRPNCGPPNLAHPAMLWHPLGTGHFNTLQHHRKLRIQYAPKFNSRQSQNRAKHTHETNDGWNRDGPRRNYTYPATYSPPLMWVWGYGTEFTSLVRSLLARCLIHPVTGLMADQTTPAAKKPSAELIAKRLARKGRKKELKLKGFEIQITGMGFETRTYRVNSSTLVSRVIQSEVIAFGPAVPKLHYRIGDWCVPAIGETTCYPGLVIERTCLLPYQDHFPGQDPPPPPC
jgi:hypothetical protein